MIRFDILRTYYYVSFLNIKKNILLNTEKETITQWKIRKKIYQYSVGM